MSRITDARVALYDALVPLMPDGRVHQYTPDNIASPCMWIGYPRVTTRTQGRGSTFIATTFTVTVAVDGAQEEQRPLLDELTAQAWDACERVPMASPIIANPRVADIGGTVATVMDIEVEVANAARSLCPPMATTTTARSNGHG